MNESQEMQTIRLAGANAISSSAIAFGVESGIAIEKCNWDIGEDLSHQHAHRLDLFTASKTVRLYFPDIELTRSEDIIRKKRIDTRLKSAIAQLIPYVPASTYTFRK